MHSYILGSNGGGERWGLDRWFVTYHDYRSYKYKWRAVIGSGMDFTYAYFPIPIVLSDNIFFHSEYYIHHHIWRFSMFKCFDQIFVNIIHNHHYRNYIVHLKKNWILMDISHFQKSDSEFNVRGKSKQNFKFRWKFE